jgi:hypothetical protein
VPGETQGLPERSGGLGGFAESCRPGSRGTIATEKGENVVLVVVGVVVLGWNGTQGNGSEALAQKEIKRNWLARSDVRASALLK